MRFPGDRPRTFPGGARRAGRVFPATAGAGAAGATLALWLRPEGLSAAGWRRDDGGAAVTVTGATYVDPTATSPAGLSFDGVNDRVDGAITVPADATCTVFVVASHDHTQTTASRGRLLDLSDTSATERSIQVTDLFGQRRVERALGDDAGSAAYVSASDAVKVTRAVFGPNFTELWEDGIWHASSALEIASRAPTAFRIGASVASTFWWKGVVHEVRVYSGTVSELDAERIEGELLDRYGLPRPFRWPGAESTATTDPAFLVPPITPAIVGQTLSIWRDQIHYATGRRPAVVTSDLAVDSSREDRWTVTPSAPGDYALEITEGAYSVETTIRAAAALVGAPVKRVLFIGDSNTNRGGAGFVEHFGKALGAQVTLIGTRQTSGYSFKHEGHDSFKWETFNSDTEVQGTVSPFWNPDTDALDMAYFAELVGAAPDVVFIALGQNDVYGSTDGTIAAACAAALVQANVIHDALVAAFPGVVIVYCLPPPGNGNPGRWDSESVRYQFRRNELAMGRALLEEFGDREAERIHVLGTSFQFDCVRGYVEEILHMNTSPGHRQIAKALVAAYTVWHSESAVARVVSATVDGLSPTALVVVYSEAVTAADATGLSLTGTSRTISSVSSGSGTTTVTYALSGAISLADAPVLHVGNARTVAASGSRKVAVGKTTVTKTNFDAVPITLGVHTWLRTDDAGASLTLVGSDVSQWSDSSGNARHVTASTGRPSRTADFGDGAPSIRFETELLYGANPLDMDADFTVVALHLGSGFPLGITDQAEGSTQEGLTWRVVAGFSIAYLTSASPTVQDQANGTGNPGNAWRVTVIRRTGTTLKSRVGTSTQGTATITSAATSTDTLALGGYRAGGNSNPSGTHDFRELQLYASHLSDSDITSVIADLAARYPSVP